MKHYNSNEKVIEKLEQRRAWQIISIVAIIILFPIMINWFISAEIIEEDFYDIFEYGFNLGIVYTLLSLSCIIFGIINLIKLLNVTNNILKCYIEFSETCVGGIGYDKVYEQENSRYFEFNYDEIRSIIKNKINFSKFPIAADVHNKDNLYNLIIHSPKGSFYFCLENIDEVIKLLSEKTGLAITINENQYEDVNTEYDEENRHNKSESQNIHNVCCPHCGKLMFFNKDEICNNMEVFCPYCDNCFIIDGLDNESSEN